MNFNVGDVVEDIYYPGDFFYLHEINPNCLLVADMETGLIMIGFIDRFRVVESSQPSVAYLELFQ